MIQPWQKLREKTLAREFGKEWRRVIFLNPDTGQEEEFTLYGQQDWSVILPVTKNGMVVTILQYYQGCNKIIRTLPGGNLDSQEEKPEEAARRELMEETGFQAAEIVSLGSPLWLSARNSWTRYFTFLGVKSKKVKEVKYDPREQIEVELIPLKNWIEMAQTEIEDPCAVIATFRALPYLNAYLK